MTRTTEIRGNQVLLGAGSLRLLLPQEEVGAAEHLASTRLQKAPGSIKLTLTEGSDARAYIALSAKMKPLAQCPADRFLSTTLAGDDDLLWCWSEVQVMIDARFEAYPLPDVVRTSATPVDHCIEYHDGLVFPCSAQRLRQFVLGAEH